MKALLFAVLCVTIPFASGLNAKEAAPTSDKEVPSWQQEMKQIDVAINRLSNLKNLELAKAARAQNQGDRLQFNSHQLSDAQRYWREADTSKEIAERYEQEIVRLKRRREHLVKQYGVVETHN